MYARTWCVASGYSRRIRATSVLGFIQAHGRTGRRDEAGIGNLDFMARFTRRDQTLLLHTPGTLSQNLVRPQSSLPIPLRLAGIRRTSGFFGSPSEIDKSAIIGRISRASRSIRRKEVKVLTQVSKRRHILQFIRSLKTCKFHLPRSGPPSRPPRATTAAACKDTWTSWMPRNPSSRKARALFLACAEPLVSGCSTCHPDGYGFVVPDDRSLYRKISSSLRETWRMHFTVIAS